MAGGRSSRFKSNKALARWKGKSLLEDLIARLGRIFPAVIVAAKKPQEYAFIQPPFAAVVVAQDRDRIHHPLSGLEAGLETMATRSGFVLACDMPFPNFKLIGALWRIYRGHDAAVCRWDRRVQPFFGFYSKNCLPAVKNGIKAGSSFEQVLGALDAAYLTEDKVRRRDSRGLSFFDIDTREDYLKAKTMKAHV